MPSGITLSTMFLGVASEKWAQLLPSTWTSNKRNCIMPNQQCRKVNPNDDLHLLYYFYGKR
jgi:hypothetical protein